MVVGNKRSSKHKISILASRLREQILTGELAAGSPMPSADELARSNGTSLVTINRIMGKLAEEGLVNRVRGRGTFVGSPLARPLTIGLCFYVPESNARQELNAAFTVFRTSAVVAAEAAGHKVLDISPSQLHDRVGGGACLKHIDALIISISCIDLPVIQILHDFKRPCVVIQQSDPYPLPFDQVVPELCTGFTEAVKLFRGHGLSHMVISGTNGTHNGRVNTISACAMIHGYSNDAIECVLSEPVIGDLGRLRGYRIGRELLGKRELDRIGIFSVSDFISFGIVDAFSEAGLRPGLDYHLVSFDDLESDGLLPFGEPTLTSVSFPKRDIAACAVELALAKISDPSDRLVTLRIPTSLGIRKTCRPL